MPQRIEPRRYRVGADPDDPERIDALDERRARHERATRGRPKVAFREILEARMKKGEPEEADALAAPSQENEALLGLDPNQSPSLVGPELNRRSARVIIRG